MERLSSGEQNLVALGAALGSNCVLCAEHYVSRARSIGFTDQQIEEAIRLADGVRRVPAQKALDAALGLLSKADGLDAGVPPEAQRIGADPGPRVSEETPGGTHMISPARADRKPCCR